MIERMLIHYDPTSDRIVLTIPEQSNRTLFLGPRDWHLCLEIVRNHYTDPERYLHRRRAVKSLGQTDRKMIEEFLRISKERNLDEMYPDALDIELEF